MLRGFARRSLRSRALPGAWSLVALLLVFPPARAGAAFRPVTGGGDPLSRDDEIVVLLGSSLPEIEGAFVEDLALFRYSSASGRFETIPFQVDERIVKVFNEGTPGEFSEPMYDVQGEEDGTLDADDEIAFFFGDAGDRADQSITWPNGAGPLRFEVAVADPRPEGDPDDRWVYLFIGAGLPTSPEVLVFWDGVETTSVSSDRLSVEYDGRWLLTGLRIEAPCGAGADLLDRVKGRADPGMDLVQDEEDWNLNSEYLGGIAGPIRAIRYVRGARSAVNMLHHDVITPYSWTRHIKLRVHPMDSIRFYLDWLPLPGAVFFSNLALTGVPVDGSPDAEVGDTLPEWTVVTTSAGDLVLLIDVPESPVFQSRRFFYRDDSGYDDALPGKPDYPDEDDAAFAAHGFELLDLADSEQNPVLATLTAFPLCTGEGGPGVADELMERTAYPVQLSATPQASCGAVRTLELERDGDDLLLFWDSLPDTEGYRVYRSDLADLPHNSWNPISETTGTTYRDTGAASDGQDVHFYSVVCAQQGGEGPW
jgi:hypothetical protein